MSDCKEVMLKAVADAHDAAIAKGMVPTRLIFTFISDDGQIQNGAVSRCVEIERDAIYTKISIGCHDDQR